MRIDDGTSALQDVRIYLTSVEARQMIATLSELLDDLSGVPRFSPSYSFLTDAEREIAIHVYEDVAELDSDFASNIAEESGRRTPRAPGDS